MHLSIENKIHQIFQQKGIHYCPLDEKFDSTCRPPKPDQTCSRDLACGYYVFKENNHVCILYHTRCWCTLKNIHTYRKEAEDTLKLWLPIIQEIPECRFAEIVWSGQGRPYIDTGSWDFVDEEETPVFMCPYSTPYNEITLIPLHEEH